MSSGSLNKIDIQSRAYKLKNELYDRCERHELSEQECRGADEYLNKILDVVEEYSY
jgi:hypothetical protein|tara:strand:- start:855 stop:1022 length:168 start_codon:yes stop_codon:yes gene_type:complete